MGDEIEENERDDNFGVRGFSSVERWRKSDIEGFASVLIETLVGHPATQSDVSNGQSIFPTDVPLFVLEMISANQSAEQGITESFNDILDVLKKSHFEILSGVDSAEVLRFVTWVEWLE
jgi:hypothetical protein